MMSPYFAKALHRIMNPSIRLSPSSGIQINLTKYSTGRCNKLCPMMSNLEEWLFDMFTYWMDLFLKMLAKSSQHSFERQFPATFKTWTELSTIKFAMVLKVSSMNWQPEQSRMRTLDASVWSNHCWKLFFVGLDSFSKALSITFPLKFKICSFFMSFRNPSGR